VNATCIAVTGLLGVLLLALPRRLAAIPLLLGAAYVSRDAVVEIGPANFTAVRILVAVGVLRILLRGERPAGGLDGVDRLVLLWALLLLGSSAFHRPGTWIFRAGLVWSDLGSYILLRVFIRDAADVRRIFRFVCVALVPVAILMLLEKVYMDNFFAALGRITDVATRAGHVRARGPFAHPILAGTVGATCFGMAVALWRRDRRYALSGLAAAAGMVYAATSTGPVLMATFIVAALCLWKLRGHVRQIRWLAVVGILALDLVMHDPVYFIIDRIDIAGGSQGWFRARLIQSAFEHLDEWWLVGTDYTRHWMATGITANEASTDITNHVLQMGVYGGLGLMITFVLILVLSFRNAGRAARSRALGRDARFAAWALGSILFGHVMNLLSITLFDQSIVFFYLVLACISALQTRAQVRRAKPAAAGASVAPGGQPVRVGAPGLAAATMMAER
jgi:hypothetical protein